MMSFSRRKRTALLSGFLLAHLFLASALPASAGLFGGGPKIPSASSMLSDVEKRYHLDPQALQDQGESFNTSASKQPSPQVSLFFNPSDPRAGEKISAKAFPMYFSTDEKSLYYTWYLKRKGCDLTNRPNAAQRELCDSDRDGRITVEDWKVEAARIIAQHGFDKAEADYTSDSDDDSYKAVFGGNTKVGVANHCFVLDAASGEKYELGTSGNISFTCPKGQTAVCLIGEGTVNPEQMNVSSDPLAPTSDTFEAFSFADTGVCYVSGYPTCSSAGDATCATGSPRCVVDPQKNPLDCGVALNACEGGGGFNPFCEHLFPSAPGHKTAQTEAGGYTFGANEEEFWGTSPQDPDTADNGNKDEANVAGLGQVNFEWNYSVGDQVGVVVEGTSMFATKYADSSSMIMWAFSKNDCPLTDKTDPDLKLGSFYKQIKGYQVDMLSAEFNLNKCLERNLVDPTQGGQATRLDVGVSASPDSPINDASQDLGGDYVEAQASIANAAKGTTEILFDWSVELSKTPQFSNPTDVTADLQRLKLLGNVKGTALDTVSVKLDIRERDASGNPILLAGKPLSDYLIDGVGYLRFTVKASENFSSDAARKGKSDVIVKFVSTDKKISAYKVDPILNPAGTAMQVKLGNLICNDDPLDRVACRTIKNEIIGLKVDPAELTNFQWTINGAPLNCSKTVVSPECEDGQQNSVNFFPISGNVGDTYTVTLNANDVVTGKVVTLARTFHVIEPSLAVASADTNTAWPKLTGVYTDVSGPATSPCPNAMCNQYSDIVSEGFAGEHLKFQAVFTPTFLSSVAKRQWTVDDILVSESPAPAMTIEWDALKAAQDVYNISLAASVVQPREIRQALRDIWNISPLESTEIHFSATAQVELREPGFAQGTLQGTKKYLAALASYFPSSLMFLFRIVLSVALLLFTARFFFVLLPAEQGGRPVFPRRGLE